MKKDYDFRVSKAKNGYVITESYFVEEKEDSRRYKSDTTICPTWNDVVEFVKTNEIKD